MIASVKNRAAIVTGVFDDGSMGETLLVTMDDRVVGARVSDGGPLRQVDARLESKPMRKRYRPKPKQAESFGRGKRVFYPSDQGGAVIRPSVLKAMDELRQHVEKQFPA